MTPEEYRKLPIPATEIAELLSAGMDYSGNRFAIFTGGGNGSGKSSIIKRISDELFASGLPPRNMGRFYTTLSTLVAEGKLFQDYRASTFSGESLWKQITAEHPTLKKLVEHPIPYLDLDLIGLLLPEARAEKKELGSGFLIKEHYYRALNNLPHLCDALSRTGLPFFVDSTMSNPSAVIDSAKQCIDKGYNTNLAICYTPPNQAIERAELRAQADGRVIQRQDLINSSRKMPTNFWDFIELITAVNSNAFLGLYDNSGKQGEFKTIGYVGKKPDLASLNPEGKIRRDCPSRFYCFEPAKYSEFRQPFFTAR